MTGDPQVETSTSTFSRRCSVLAEVAAPPETVWGLLTTAEEFPRWNSTVGAIEGTIADGEKIVVRVPDAPRAFTLRVSGFVAPRAMTWSSGGAPMFSGVRTFTLEPVAVGTRFSMTEEFRGVLMPLIGRTLPDFAPAFERYARDLQQEAGRLAAGGS